MRDHLSVLIVDDHPMVRESLIRHFRRIAKRIDVTEAATYAELQKALEIAPSPDLITLDLTIPGAGQSGALAWVREKFPDVPVAVVSGISDQAVVAEALRLGAAGFIPKTMMGKTLVNALMLILDGQRFFPAEILGGPRAQDGQEPGASGAPVPELTKRQIEVLASLTQGKSNKEIARLLGVEEITVKVHLQAIFRKLGVSNRVQAVRKAIELGLDRATP